MRLMDPPNAQHIKSGQTVGPFPSLLPLPCVSTVPSPFAPAVAGWLRRRHALALLPPRACCAVPARARRARSLPELAAPCPPELAAPAPFPSSPRPALSSPPRSLLELAAPAAFGGASATAASPSSRAMVPRRRTDRPLRRPAGGRGPVSRCAPGWPGPKSVAGDAERRRSVGDLPVTRLPFREISSLLCSVQRLASVASPVSTTAACAGGASGERRGGLCRWPRRCGCGGSVGSLIGGSRPDTRGPEADESERWERPLLSIADPFLPIFAFSLGPGRTVRGQRADALSVWVALLGHLFCPDDPNGQNGSSH
ncbi:translation initiation factor IF-2 [Triticum aestivum]|uniref:translation initiation factor IF-2 n=1 Tax=Triticum aestivum TaxID=4565 RepID=UPI001D01BDFF|nr:translation initiation factor IF-2-like [Triticum aestivum]XP_044319920.1 translation initiation factor IF-2-like [Triticum aestivum]